nr:DUF4878 domain-containing protein [uncultured Capnocytophaga sp.]
MKKLFLSLFLLGSLFLVSCSGNSPKAVAEKFMKAIYDYDFKEAQKYCDQPTAQMLSALEGFSKAVPEKEKKVKKFTITKEEINGDTAKVYFKTEGEEKEDTVDLKKIDGKWLVTVNKENGKEGGKTPSMDVPDTQEDEEEEGASVIEEAEDATSTTEANQ